MKTLDPDSRHASIKGYRLRSVQLPLSAASASLVGGTLTVYASTERVATTMLGRVALLAAALAMLGLSSMERGRGLAVGKSADHHWAICSIIALMGIGVANLAGQISTAAPAMAQLAVLLVLVLVNGRASRWSTTTCIVATASMLLFVIFNLYAILFTTADGGLFENPNALGAASVALALIAGRLVAAIRGVARFLWWPLFLGLAALVVYSAARAALAALVIAVTWTSVCRVVSESASRKIFGAVVCAAVAFAAIFVIFSFELTETSADLELFGKAILTGRDEIWPVVMLAVLDAPLFGHGAGSVPGDLLPGRLEGLSAHNGFLQIGFQFGVLGVLCVVGLVLSLGLGHYAGVDRPTREYTRAVLIAAVVHEVFEVCLTQNHFGIGFAFWVAAIVSQRPAGVSVRSLGAVKQGEAPRSDRRSAPTQHEIQGQPFESQRAVP